MLHCEIHLPDTFYRLSALCELFVSVVCSAQHAFVLQTLPRILNKGYVFHLVYFTTSQAYGNLYYMVPHVTTEMR